MTSVSYSNACHHRYPQPARYFTLLPNTQEGSILVENARAHSEQNEIGQRRGDEIRTFGESEGEWHHLKNY